MIYWRIKTPGKFWATWQDGTAADVDEAKLDSMASVTDDNGNLYDWANGIRVEMFNCIDIDDYRIDDEQVRQFWQNHFGVS